MNTNKETFKLLQLSEDSKSISDLELPELINQKKRRVRRKTRPRTITPRQHQEVKKSNQCNRLILWISIFLISCWSLTLSYMMAVIHAENSSLETQIRKSSQVNVPLRAGTKKMRKRRELDALVAHSLAKRSVNKNNVENGVHSQDQLLSPSTDEQEDFGWPKIARSSNRNRYKKNPFLRICGPIVFLMCISLSVGFMYWLYFDLREQLYEYRQKVEEVTVTSQNLPETLQKWHESSKNLEQNQTLIYGKITELQHFLQNLSTDLVQIKNLFNEKKDYSKDEKIVADFGAKIQSINLDVKDIKEKFNKLQKVADDSNKEITFLKSNISNMNNFSKEIGNYSKLLNNITEEFPSLRILSTSFETMNYTLSLRMNDIDETLREQKEFISSLSKDSVNITSHIKTIEESKELIELKNKTQSLDNKFKELQSDINLCKNQIQVINEKGNEKSLNKTTTSTSVNTNTSTINTIDPMKR